MIKAIIFDVGDVLLKVDRNKLYKKFSKLNKMPVENMRGRYTPFIEKYYDSGLLSTQEFYHRSIKMLRLDISKKKFFKIWETYLIPLWENIRLLKKLSKSYTIMALANTNERDYMDIKRKYKLFGIKLELYIASYKLKIKKPNKKIYLYALKKSGYKAEECLFIDDKIENVKAAKSLGINAIHYKSYRQLLKEMKGLGIDINGTN